MTQMIVLTDKMNSEINGMVQSYDDLENKPMINGVTLEGDLTTEELGIKGIPYVIIDETLDGWVVGSGNVQDVIDAVKNNKPYLIYLPNNVVDGYYSIADVVQLVENTLNVASFTHYPNNKHEWRYFRLWGNNNVQLYDIRTFTYITADTFNEAIEEVNDNIDNSKIPYVVITTRTATSTDLEYTGDLNGVINAIKNQTPYNAYFYNKATYYGVINALYDIDFVFYNDVSNSGTFYVHSEGAGGGHRISRLTFSFDGTNYQLGTISVELKNYASTSYVDEQINEQIGDINTILENIIG